VTERFDATLELTSETATAVEVPVDVPAVFGAKRPPVRGTINGTPFRSTIAVYGGRYYLGINRRLRDEAGVAAGEKVVIELDRDDEPRVIDLPVEVAKALTVRARSIFDALPYTHQREYVEWITEAKRDETRERRLAKMVEMLEDGVRHP
jgi:hypothetical protein